MLMPDRNDVVNSYRFGFNTQEKVDEIAGAGNHYTAEFWEYDPRAVMRWNLDPKPNPLFSPYAIMQCNPIMYIDHKGDSVGTSFTNPDVKAQGDEGGKMDVLVINNRGNLKSKTIKTSQIQSPYSNQDSDYAKEYSQARKHSGYDDYMSKDENQYTTTEEKLHNIGAHEETHLKEPRGLSTYNSEKAAFSNEVKAAKDYKATKQNK
ncbi:MAG: hypothetical protein ACK4K0_01640 [Flavobacteriales bacterium]